jgi:spore coat protein U-like protein
MKTQKLNSHVLSLAVASILAVGVGAFSGSSLAGTNSATLGVSAAISDTCEVSTTAVAFGTYDPLSATDHDIGTAKVTMTCTTGSAPKVGLGQGANAFTGSTDLLPLRQMKSTGNYLLRYYLYSNAGYSTVWGNDTTALNPGAAGDGASHDLLIYARIPKAQNVHTAADFADTVSVAVTF